MAIALDAATSANSGAWISGTSYSWSHTCTGSNLILVVGLYQYNVGASDLVTGVTYNGVAMTRVNKATILNDTTYLYYLINPSTGSNSIAVTLSSSSSFQAAGAVSYTGVKQTGQPDSSATNTAASPATSLTLSTTVVANNSWVIGMFRSDSTNNSQSAGTTRRGGYATGGVDLCDSNAAVGTGSQSLQETNSASNWDGCVMSIAPFVSTSNPSFLLNFV